MQRALAEFPYADMAERILRRYYVSGGKSPQQPFRAAAALPPDPAPRQLELVVAANFVEVYLAGEGHDGLVGVNYLEKIQPPTLASLYGAILAGVDYVLMGAGIPKFIPGAIDRLSRGEAAELPIQVAGAPSGETTVVRFDPESFGAGPPPALKRPKFLAIVASATLASMLARKASGRVDGFIVEGPTAGGHNAPPRGEGALNERGEPVYGPRDQVDLAAMRALGLPFWLAGSYGTPEQVVAAIGQGAAGVQVGTAFALCEESGLREDLKRQALELSGAGNVDVLTDPAASPTGFPFKVLQLQGSLSDANVYADRKRICDLGFLRQYYRLEDGTLGWRCPAEPETAYVRKGGDLADTVGRKCICNALMANVGVAQCRSEVGAELPLVTCGNDAASVASFIPAGAASYTARHVIERLLAGSTAPSPLPAIQTAPPMVDAPIADGQSLAAVAR
jgi:nitronate monooxygenase